jgi:antitoxin HicB
MTDASRYPAQVFWSDEDEGFIAIAPDLPGCSAFGDTQAEAIAELLNAIEAWKEAATKAGNSVPDPSSPGQASGKLLLRLPKSLHARVIASASFEGVSLNAYLNVLIAGEDATRRHAREYVTASSARVSEDFASEIVASYRRGRIELDEPRRASSAQFLANAISAVSDQALVEIESVPPSRKRA